MNWFAHISRKKTQRSALAFTYMAFVFVALLATPGGCQRTEQNEKTIRLAYVNWADGIAITNLARAILEDEFGYEVELIMADPGPVFASVSTGDSDAFLDAWLPFTHEDYWQRFGDQLEDLGPIYEGCQLGLVVPNDSPVRTISELNEHRSLFDNRIQGIDSGSGLMRLTRKAIESYNLELELVPASGPAMTAALKKAMKNDEPIVVTGWKPHWKFIRWNLRFLEDPKGVYGREERIHAIARRGLEQEMPEVVTFFRNMKLTDQQLGSLMDQINQSSGDPIRVARQWIDKHRELVNGWLPDNLSKPDETQSQQNGEAGGDAESDS